MPEELADRRDFYRIDDTVAISYQVMDACHQPDSKYFPFNNEAEIFHLSSNLQTLESEAHHLLRVINDKNRAIAQYLKNIDRRLQLMGNAIASCSSELLNLPKQKVSLSEGGLSLNQADPLPVDQYLAIKLVLQPSHAGLLITGKIVKCDKIKTGYHNRITFEHILEPDRQLLAKHIIQYQAKQRRQQLEQSKQESSS
ncbi:PilZ domain-containing protein [Endozoicomonas sp. SM1973]|uniref:PilZ domain-containing protein n=1 Tax=Spartinivicinus marinus TaxID=2994442 RepID=A0A853HX94_9GAMM|nr:PilZ domain-containing protein [Spartinivicinus marinus]MCX4029415.1 PilZ domain-containing protein [Spartinivicinus marinus]NYZ64989.1 PilZ domain-containing protein [Spartinivicinus marinus]